MDSEEIVKKYKLKDKSWTYKGFHAILHTFFPVQETVFHPVKDHFGICANIVAMFIKEDYLHWYWCTDDMDELRKFAIEKTNKDPKFLDSLIKEWHNRLELFKKEIKKAEKAKLSTLSDKGLLNLYEHFYRAYVYEYGIAINLQDSFSMHADKFIKPILKAIMASNWEDMNNIEEHFATLTSPIKDSFIMDEYKARVRILKMIKDDSKLFAIFKKGKEEVIQELSSYPKLKKQLREHAKKYFWIQNNYAKMPVLGADDFIGKIAEDLRLDPEFEIRQMDERLLSTKEAKKKLIEKLNIAEDFQNLVRIAEIFSYMQDERKKYVLISNYFQRLFLDEIGKRLNLTRREMDYTIFPELKEMLLKKKFNKKELQERYNGCLCIMTLDGYELLTGKVAEKVYKEIFSPDLDKDEIIGSCASKGKIMGKVKIIQKTHDLINFQQGDILVTSMTRPEMVVALKKAAGIITDEGGVTSHAAIVSREMGIPCLIGTQVATKVLKDGDMVELDASNGIAKILKKS